MAKFCTKCGKEINEDAVICVHCGSSIDPTATNPNDSNSKSWWWLGFLTSLFCTPIIGLILWLVWKDEAPLKARNVGLGTLWSLVAGFGIGIIVGIIYFIVIASAMGISSGMAVAPILGAIGMLA